MSHRKVVPVALGFFLVFASAGLVGSRQAGVRNSLWDGSVRQVRVFLQDNWRDVGPRPPLD